MQQPKKPSEKKYVGAGNTITESALGTRYVQSVTVNFDEFLPSQVINTVIKTTRK